jgi:hypothetical protein
MLHTAHHESILRARLARLAISSPAACCKVKTSAAVALAK